MPKQVRPVLGEPLRYWVESSVENEPHLVDMLEHNGNGQCSCMHFQVRCQTAYRLNDYRIVNHGYPNATRCKHINTAMLYIADRLIEGVQNEIRQKTQD